MGEAQRGAAADHRTKWKQGWAHLCIYFEGPRYKHICWGAWEDGGGGAREGDIVQGSGERWAAKTLGWNTTKAGLLGLVLAICVPRAPVRLLLAECAGGAVEAEEQEGWEE